MRLVLIGAGPKAIAIAAKCHVLRELGWQTPDLCIIDKHGVGANWNGRNGFTHGRHSLGTPPEKDIGFPYESGFGPRVDRAMLAYSWSAFKVDSAEYSEWVDRGKPHPKHTEWQRYLSWVSERVRVEIRTAEVVAIHSHGREWQIDFQKSTNDFDSVRGEGLVLTGPGEPLRLPGEPANHSRVLNGQNFWTRLDDLDRVEDGDEIAIIGGGETAASITVTLAHIFENREIGIKVINRQGCLFSRGESYDENRSYSDPSEWTDIPLAARKEIIERTDRGVFSLYSKKSLDQAKNVRHLMLNVQAVRMVRGFPHVFGSVGDRSLEYPFSYIVSAAGFDPLWFVRIGRGPWKHRLTNRAKVSQKIESDLSVRGISPKLHLPMLAGLAQGPGFPNLSCLGHLSDRILSPYILPRRG